MDTVNIATLPTQAPDKSITPSHALIFYHDRMGNSVITKHDIAYRNKRASLSAGRPFNQASLARLVDILNNDLSENEVIIPENVLQHNHSSLTWWVPAAKRTMWFRPNKKKHSYNVPWPALLFHANKCTLSVAALKTNTRPESTTPLYHAPLMNIYSHGGLCLGNCIPPISFDFSTRTQWEALLYDSFFTHTNHDHTLKVKGMPKTNNKQHLTFWRSLIDAKRFPKSTLLPMELSLMQFIQRGAR